MYWALFWMGGSGKENNFGGWGCVAMSVFKWGWMGVSGDGYTA